MLVYTEADIFYSHCEILVNPVNCLGVCGAGLARHFAANFPDPTRQYKKWCRDGEFKVGMPRLAYPILFFPTKQHFKDPSRLEWIDAGLARTRQLLYEAAATKSWDGIAIPALGCGLGGLKWADVKPLLVKHLGDLKMKVEVYHRADV